MDDPMMVGGAGSLLPGSSAGILDLDPSTIHHHRQQQPRHQMTPLFDAPNLPPPPPPHYAKGISSSSAGVSDDEVHLPAFAAGGGCGGGGEENCPDPSFQSGPSADRVKKGSPWQRMKWTDEMVRLMISLVAHVGDHEDVGHDLDGGGGRRKHGGGGIGGGGAALQKKGKWKTVSKLMLEKGFCISPQQCEDKFNDLNKRYKRLNEILGRGTSCQVVENPVLLDSMPHISPKAKEDVRKILSSKQLFYREMCAYHNGQRIPSCHDTDAQGSNPPKPTPLSEGNAHVHEEEEEEDEEDEDEDGDFGRRSTEGFRTELEGVLHSNTMSLQDQREWFKKRALELSEERLDIDAEAFLLEKRMFKWQRFRSKKDRELERQRLENERLRLENEQMVMQVRQKELELEFKITTNS